MLIKNQCPSLVYLWLAHVGVWQRPTHNCEAISLQLKMSKFGWWWGEISVLGVALAIKLKEMAAHSSVLA